MVKIAFSGKIGSGKSTTASILRDVIVERGIVEPYIVSFAGKLKKIAVDLFGMTQKDRGLLINIGLKMREIEPNVWINYALRDIEDKSIIIDDLRFPNEYVRLRSEGFVLIRINIDKELQLKRIKKTYPNEWEQHVENSNNPSEVSLDNYEFDHYINTTPEDTIDTIKNKLISFNLVNF